MKKCHQDKVDFWRERILECRTSGLTDRQYCIDNNLIHSTFYYWVKKLKLASVEKKLDTKVIPILVHQEVVPLVSFEDLSFQSPEKSTAVILRFKSITLEIQNGASESAITNTIKALKQLC